MKIEKYSFTQDVPRALCALLKKKYAAKSNFDYFLSDYEKSYAYCIDNENIIFTPIALYENDELTAHVALIIDKRLPEGEAFLGFFESPDNQKVFQLLWKSLVDEAKERAITVLKGPINGSVWHQYRCIKYSDETSFFKSELLCEPYYYSLLNSKSPTAEVVYYSAYREKFDTVLKIIEGGAEKFASAGFSIKSVKTVTLDDLQTIAAISRTIFSRNWGYTNLSDKEFLNLYSSDKLDMHLNKLYVLYKDEKIIGYSSTSTENKNTLICKTICILPQYQGLGLGNALAYVVHNEAINEGFTKVIYALIREGNQIKNFPQEDIVIFRRYAAFEYKV